MAVRGRAWPCVAEGLARLSRPHPPSHDTAKAPALNHPSPPLDTHHSHSLRLDVRAREASEPAFPCPELRPSLLPPRPAMDGDPAVEPELDSFSLFLPLPYRVALIILLGMQQIRSHGRTPPG